jgi:hypothetical protein
MTAIEEIERLIEKLPSEEFKQLAAWLDQRRPSRKADLLLQEGLTHPGPAVLEAIQPAGAPIVLRDHSAFLNSYAPEDEGLYDDAPAR